MKIAAVLGAMVLQIGTAQAQSVLEVGTRVALCKRVTNDADRLKCFDLAVTPAPEPAPVATPPAAAAKATAWTITEDRSPIDDSAQFQADLLSTNAKNLLAVRCKERKLEVAIGTDNYLGSQHIKVLIRINNQKPSEANWPASTTGRAVFVPAAEPFIRGIPDEGKLWIRMTDFRGANYDATFEIGSFSAIRDKVLATCPRPQNTTRK